MTATVCACCGSTDPQRIHYAHCTARSARAAVIGAADTVAGEIERLKVENTALHAIIEEAAEVFLSLAEAWPDEYSNWLPAARSALIGDQMDVIHRDDERRRGVTQSDLIAKFSANRCDQLRDENSELHCRVQELEAANTYLQGEVTRLLADVITARNERDEARAQRRCSVSAVTDICLCGCDIGDHNSDTVCGYEMDCGCTGYELHAGPGGTP